MTPNETNLFQLCLFGSLKDTLGVTEIAVLAAQQTELEMIGFALFPLKYGTLKYSSQERHRLEQLFLRKTHSILLIQKASIKVTLTAINI